MNPTSLLIKYLSYAVLILFIAAQWVYIGALNNKIDSYKNDVQTQNAAYVALNKQWEKDALEKKKKDDATRVKTKQILSKPEPNNTTCQAAINYALEEARRITHAYQ